MFYVKFRENPSSYFILIVETQKQCEVEARI